MLHDFVDDKLVEAYKQTEHRVFLESFYYAVCSDNLSIALSLVDKGFDYTKKISFHKSALTVAIEHDSISVLRFVLLQSLKDNKHLAYSDLEKVLNWSLAAKHFEVAELTLACFDTKYVSDVHLEQLMTVRHFLVLLNEELSLKGEITRDKKHHLASLLSRRLLSKPQLRHLYEIWKRSYPLDNQDALDIYNMLADEYYEVDKNKRMRSLYTEITEFLFMCPVLIFCSVLVFLVLNNIYDYLDYAGYFSYFSVRPAYQQFDILMMAMFITLSLGMFIIFYTAIKTFYQSFRKTLLLRQEQHDRDFLKYSRRGDFEKVEMLAQKYSVHINIIAGIAATTPLFEATRNGHEKIIVFLNQHSALSSESQGIKIERGKSQQSDNAEMPSEKSN